MKKKIGFIFLCYLCFALIFGGCAGQDKKQTDSSEEGTAVYYTNESGTRLIPVKKKLDLTSDDPQENVKTMLKQMKNVNDDAEYKSAIPDGVIINSAAVSNNIVAVDFSTGYNKLDENEDLICRAGIVYTLTQIDGINYVSFSVSGKAMLDTDGKAIGALGRDSFVFGELPME